MPTADKPMIIGVPDAAFPEFVKVDSDGNISGFCIDIFCKIISSGRLKYSLPFEFQHVKGSYDDLVELVHNKTLDAAIGDIPIIAERVDKVDFTQPYMESGLSIIVPETAERTEWMFARPFTAKMWASTGGILVYTIFIIWFLERLSSPEFDLPLQNQIGTAAWFAFTTLTFSQRERVHNNLTRVVVVMWLFVVLILNSSYTANLSSMLTIQRLKPNVTDIEMLKTTNSKVGLDNTSFVVDYLVNILKFDPDNFINITSESNYTTESRNKNITAALLELPYVTVFMNKYCKGYTATTPFYRFGGLGFIFQKGSPFARDFTKVILELLENGEIMKLEKKWLTTCSDCPNNGTSDGPERLDVKNFMGLYLISGAISTICLLSSFTIMLKKFQQHQDAYGNASEDESVWNKTVRMARFVYNREFSVPNRDANFVDVLELTASEEHAITSTP